MATILTMETTVLTATDNHSKSVQPDAEFLEFLASMTEVDGKMTDPLDMIEMKENEIFDAVETKTTEDTDNYRKLNSEKIMKNKAKDETTAKENR